nr:transposase [uncultured Draconibacterium sp.]
MHAHYREIFNFFDQRSTNASSESFNAKLKALRATLNTSFLESLKSMPEKVEFTRFRS